MPGVMDTVKDERMLYESEDRSLTVTTHRVRYLKRGLARSGRVASVLLSDIDGIEYGLERRPLFMQLAVIAVIFGVAATFAVEEEEAFVFLGLFPAVLFVAAYFVIRKRGLRFMAGRLTIHVPRFKGGVLSAESLIGAIEEARITGDDAKPASKAPHFTTWRDTKAPASEPTTA